MDIDLIKANLSGTYSELKEPYDMFRKVLWDAKSGLYFILWFKQESDIQSFNISGIHEIFTMPPGAYFLAYNDMVDQLIKHTPKQVGAPGGASGLFRADAPGALW